MLPSLQFIRKRRCKRSVQRSARCARAGALWAARLPEQPHYILVCSIGEARIPVKPCVDGHILLPMNAICGHTYHPVLPANGGCRVCKINAAVPAPDDGCIADWGYERMVIIDVAKAGAAVFAECNTLTFALIVAHVCHDGPIRQLYQLSFIHVRQVCLRDGIRGAAII